MRPCACGLHRLPRAGGRRGDSAAAHRRSVGRRFNTDIDVTARRAGIIPRAEPLALFSLVATIILLHLGAIGVGGHFHRRRV